MKNSNKLANNFFSLGYNPKGLNSIIYPDERFNQKNVIMTLSNFKKIHKQSELIKFFKLDTTDYRVLPLPPLLNDNRCLWRF